MISSKRFYDCVVVGGGPAGATVGTLLADQGHSVLILEAASFPRHHVGESLMPQTYWTLKRLGMLDRLRASDFPLKQSVQFVSASGKDSQPYYFPDRDPNEWSTTWQVRRDRFDQMMLDNAREHGVEVHEGVRVGQVLFDGTRAEGPQRAVGVHVKGNGSGQDIGAKVVIDASGMSALLSRQLDIREPDPVLRRAAIYAYFRGAQRGEGRDAGATIIIHTPDRKGWFWFIPLPEDVTSIGVVATPAYLCTGRGDDPLETLKEEIAECPGIRHRLADAERLSQAYVTSDFSYRSTRVAGDGWVLVGDAFGFLDPVYSAGVFLALKSGEFAADAVHGALEADDLSAARLGGFQEELGAGMRRIEQLIHVFYDRSFSFAKFHREHPDSRDHIVRLLIGDIFNPEVGEVFDILQPYLSPSPSPLRPSVSLNQGPEPQASAGATPPSDGSSAT